MSDPLLKQFYNLFKYRALSYGPIFSINFNSKTQHFINVKMNILAKI